MQDNSRCLLMWKLLASLKIDSSCSLSATVKIRRRRLLEEDCSEGGGEEFVLESITSSLSVEADLNSIIRSTYLEVILGEPLLVDIAAV